MANDHDAAEKTHCFRLTGEVDGTRLTFDLSDGEHFSARPESAMSCSRWRASPDVRPP